MLDKLPLDYNNPANLVKIEGLLCSVTVGKTIARVAT